MEPADRLAIATLAARYAQAVDRRDATALASLFTPDVVFVLPPELNGTDARSELRGRQAVVLSVMTAVSRNLATRHVVEQQVIDIDSPDLAHAETYCTAHHIYARKDGHRDKRIAIRYQDTFARTEGTWLFSRRDLVIDFAENVPVSLPVPRATGV